MALHSHSASISGVHDQGVGGAEPRAQSSARLGKRGTRLAGNGGKKHTQIARSRMAASGAYASFLRSQFRWALVAHGRFARDHFRQASRRLWPKLQAWSSRHWLTCARIDCQIGAQLGCLWRVRRSASGRQRRGRMGMAAGDHVVDRPLQLAWVAPRATRPQSAAGACHVADCGRATEGAHADR